jgi:hypothetical protein
MRKDFSDLIKDGRLAPGVHPLPDLLEMEAEAVLDAFRASQRQDFAQVIGEVDRAQGPLHTLFDGIRQAAAPGNPILELAPFRPGALHALFEDLHDHVMSHPVWRHPFFIRAFQGPLELEPVQRFAVQYFNQIKNTRQCVALAVGRFHGLMDLPYGPSVNERVSEITQIALAQLVADEYGVGVHPADDYPGLASLFSSVTHMTLYRQLFDGLGIPASDQDRPMLGGVADNVLTQRLLASHPAFSPLESLASVGLGMEWGVPEFFSLLLGGLIRFGRDTGLAITRHHLDVFIAHVRYDVMHAISVMLVTSLHMPNAGDMDRVKGSCNALMAARFAMMSELFEHVFGSPCPSLADLAPEPRYRLKDRRIADALIQARAQVPPERVADGAAYASRSGLPFLFH